MRYFGVPLAEIDVLIARKHLHSVGGTSQRKRLGVKKVFSDIFALKSGSQLY